MVLENILNIILSICSVFTLFTGVLAVYMFVYLIQKNALSLNLQTIVHFIFIYRDYTKQVNGKVGLPYRLFILSLISWVCIPIIHMIPELKKMSAPELIIAGSVAFLVIPIAVCVFYAVAQDNYYK